MNIKRILFSYIAMAICLLSGCSRYKEFTSTRLIISGMSAQESHDLILNGISDDGDTFSVLIRGNQTGPEIEIPVGEWTFYGIHWIDTNSYCSFERKKILGPNQSVVINFSRETCKSETFSSKKYVANNSANTKPVVFLPCPPKKSSPKNFEVTSESEYQQYCRQDFGLESMRITFPTIGVSTLSKPDISYREVITKCINYEEEDNDSTILNDLPIGGNDSPPFVVKVEFYEDINCKDKVSEATLDRFAWDTRGIADYVVEQDDNNEVMNIVILRSDLSHPEDDSQDHNPMCGDGITDVESGEACDDSNTENEVLCDYGVATCSACSDDCSKILELTGSYCGDNITDLNDGEECDDGQETASCSATCTEITSFISTWRTAEKNETITIPTVGGLIYNYTIDWGDNTVEVIKIADPPQHTYSTAGDYTITISGTFPRIYFNNTAADIEKIISISNLGDVGWTSFEGAFKGCTNLGEIYGGNTSNVTSMYSMFEEALNAEPDTSEWNTSNVTSMYSMFDNATKANPDTSNWDTSEVTNMSFMFRRAEDAVPNTETWDTSKVTDMSYMFKEASAANPNTATWDTSKVTDMTSMFYSASSATPNTSEWDTSKVTLMGSMFEEALNAEPDTSKWDTSNVTSMYSMFYEATKANPDTSNWDTSEVTNMSFMFKGAEDAVPNTETWDTSKVTDMSYMFKEASAANPNTATWDTSKVTDMTDMFYSASSATPNTSEWDTSEVTLMESMFEEALNAEPDTSKWNTSNVTSMYSMFYGAGSADPDTSTWDLGEVTDMNYMFSFSGISDANYSKFLVMAETTSQQNEIQLGYVPASYSEGVAATARGNLTKAIASGGHKWSISDDGSTGVNSCGDSTLDTALGEECDTGGDSATCSATCTEKTDFVTTWVLTDDLTITLPLVQEDSDENAFSYNFEVCWGDDEGESETCSNITSYDDPDRTFTYAEAGEYTVTISGVMESIQFGHADFADERDKLTEINNLGDVGWTSFKSSFYGCSALGEVSGGNTSGVTSMFYMFGSSTATTINSDNWDTSNVESMAAMFLGCASCQPALSSWNTSNVTDMSQMFKHAMSVDSSVRNWNTSKVTNFWRMFQREWFVDNEDDIVNPDVELWDTSNVTHMSFMFENTKVANPDVSKWNTSSVTSMQALFKGNQIVQPDVSDWDTSNVTNFRDMFNGATSANPDMSEWNVVKGSNMTAIFTNSGISDENYSNFLVMAGGCLDDPSPCTRKFNVSLGNIGDGNVKFYGEEAAIARKSLVDINGWSFNDGGGYALVESLMNWDDANSNCENNEGYLATVDSSNVRDTLTDICFPDSWNGDSSDDCWLGLKNTNGSGDAASPPIVSGDWTEGVAYSSSDFSLDSIDHFGTDKCLNFEAQYPDGTLEGATCSNTRRSICEYPAD